MTLQASGVIGVDNINVELGRASNANTNLDESASRYLAEVPTGTISLSNFYGKSNFKATWSGSSVGTSGGYYAGINVSATLFRGQGEIASRYTGWFTSSATSISPQGSLTVGSSYNPATLHGINTSGNAFRIYVNGGGSFGPWIYMGPGGFTGGSTTQYNWAQITAIYYLTTAWETSAGSLRCSAKYGVTTGYGAWVTIS